MSCFRTHGSGAFEFEHMDHAQLDMGRTFFRKVRVLKPFADLQPGDIVDGVSVNPNSFECFYWLHGKFQDRVTFPISELVLGVDANSKSQ